MQNFSSLEQKLDNPILWSHIRSLKKQLQQVILHTQGISVYAWEIIPPYLFLNLLQLLQQ